MKKFKSFLKANFNIQISDGDLFIISMFLMWIIVDNSTVWFVQTYQDQMGIKCKKMNIKRRYGNYFARTPVGFLHPIS